MATLLGGVVLMIGFFVSGDPGAATPVDTAAPSGETDTPADRRGPHLACDPAILEACQAAAEILDMAATTWTLGDTAPGEGVVLASAQDLEASQIDTEGATVVASSPIVIAAWRDRAQILLASCGQIDEACLGSSVGMDWETLGGPGGWGAFKLGLADPTQSEAAMLAWSVLAPEITSESLDSLRSTLRIQAPSDTELLREVITFGDSRADVVVSTEVVIVNQFENAIGRGGRLEISYLDRGPWMDYVAVAIGRGSGSIVEDLAREDVRASMTAAGLRPADGTVGELPPPMAEPGEVGEAPDPATRATLADVWESRT